PARTPLGDLELVDVNQAQLWQSLGLQQLGADWLWTLER
ncbi:MAG: bifunctional diaminohydroxyphosphoribosylaminopyrimidine deaminase/5-amino-6-(5-phosphoribosylamino)uracil reductase, partial [Cyanobacteria bacterium K_DeepCast_0m_m1_088]|nr:bifunctional diaminohydroxyphosphoribosylaminopyrimidine deaminase/5-amino-6-(5-phosphoribosylamino)uracil reductase [Cyanobacteria bacterium K_DeepCast_0m_m1_088]